MEKIPEFVEEKNSQWKKHNSFDEYPTVYSIVIIESKKIGQQGIYTLTMNKVLSIHDFGYMVGIWSGESGSNSEVYKDYDLALAKGKEELNKMAIAFEKEYEDMKTQIRQNVFETNSSSTHSISIAESTTDDIMDTLEIDENGNINLLGGEFGWEWEVYSDAQIKASYMAIYTQSWCGTQKEDFTKILKDVIVKQTGCKEVIFKFSTEFRPEDSGLDWSYIDHQSVESADLHYLFEDTEKLRQFIFNRKSELRTGNDNSGPSDSSYDDGNNEDDPDSYSDDGSGIVRWA